LTADFSAATVASMMLHAMIRERGLKQNWVADKVGLSQSYFNEIALGKRPMPPALIRPLAKILRVTADELSQVARSYTHVEPPA
jgi:transcriptional regulator with XRE-family HTH domain